MKIKFNFKLTVFLVSLFISLLILILGNKNSYCLSFGFICLGLSIALYVWYNNEKSINSIAEIDSQVEIIEDDETVDDNEKTYMISQLYLRQSKLIKNKKKVARVFYITAVLFVFIGIIALF
ncbi:MAG: hypothetical protein IJW36_00240 [Clostridia bacterium]|nr:hypothetical protein [Clostridia bacterium]